MDSITQGALGAAIGEAILGKKIGHKGAIAGAVIATIPDLDVILYFFYDSYDMLSIHRGFSHSIFFSILGSFLITFLLSKIKWFEGIDYKRLYFFSWVVLFTHILLDTFTSYGTQLFSPFSDRRLGFDSINVVDPLYTIPLIFGLVLSLWIFKTKPSRSIYNKCGLIISTMYLVLTLVIKQVINADFSENLIQESIDYNSISSIPVGVANINWYGVAKSDDSIYMQKLSVLNNVNNTIETFPINDFYLDEIDYNVADKMRWFAKGFYTVEKVNEKIRIFNLQVDMRGIVKNRGGKSPTIGYFEVSNENGELKFSSGSINN